MSLLWCEISHCLCSSAGKAHVQREVQVVKPSANLQAVKHHKAAVMMTL